MKSLLLVAMAITASSLSAELESFSFVPSGSEVLTFDKFDASFGTLTGVTVKWKLGATGGSLQADNEGAGAGAVVAKVDIFGSVTAAGVTGLGAIPGIALSSTKGFAIGAHDFDDVVTSPIGTFDAGAGDPDYGVALFDDAGPLMGMFAVAPAHFASFVASLGDTTFTLTPAALTVFSTTGVSGLVTVTSQPEVYGEVEVIYDYAPIPEPSTIAGLAAAGLLGLVIVRRRR